MKVTQLLKCITIALFIGLNAVPAMAQKNIDKLIEEIEKREDASVNSVVKRDPKTRKIISIVKSFSLKDDKMTKRLIDAFEKDEEYTVTAIKDIPRGRKDATRANFTFIFQKENEKRTYTFNVNGVGSSINISVIIKQSKQGDINASDFTLYFDGTSNNFNFDMYNEQIEELKESVKKYKENLKAKHISRLQVGLNEQFRLECDTLKVNL